MLTTTAFSIPFSVLVSSASSRRHVQRLCSDSSLWCAHVYTRACQDWFCARYGKARIWFTSSCTQALNAAAFLLNLRPEDEVIMPSFTHASTANAFARHHARLVFVDVVPETMTIAASRVEAAITPKTRAIVVVHYGGMAPDMHALAQIAQKHAITLIEDNAHGMGARYDNQPLGTWGHMCAFSFERQKNISCGQGGALLIKDKTKWRRMDEYYAVGTNSAAFYADKVDCYEWVGLGDKIMPSELTMAYLYGALEEAEAITKARQRRWMEYHACLASLEADGYIKRPHPLSAQQHNAHIFFLHTCSPEARTALIQHLHDAGIGACFHYSPLHRSPMGQKTGRFHGQDTYTSIASRTLLRLPLHAALTKAQLQQVVKAINTFYRRIWVRPSTQKKNRRLFVADV